jgi:hypothetical protein
MTKYQVRSRELVDVVNDLKSQRLIKAPYFQRNLVWRALHQVDFIKTILMGLPFPQVFVAKGEIDLETMRTTSYLVDGQQRLTAIQQYVNGKFSVDGRTFDALSDDEKEEFLKYQVPIIDLDIKKDDPVLKEIFKRLNRTFYALSLIEKQSGEYAASDMMIIAKLLADQFFIMEEDSSGKLISRDIDPMVPPEILKKARKLKVMNFRKLAAEIFTDQEKARMVPLSFNLNLLTTCSVGWYNRNSSVQVLLDSVEYDFDHYFSIGQDLEKVAEFVLGMKMKSGSYWYNKANAFSLIVALFQNFSNLSEIDSAALKKTLDEFEMQLPKDYALAAKEAVNNKRERILRNEYLQAMLFAPN